MNTQIFHFIKYDLKKGHFNVYFNLHLRSYGQLFVLVFLIDLFLVIVLPTISTAMFLALD